MSFSGHSWVGSYPPCRDAVGVFYSPSRLGHVKWEWVKSPLEMSMVWAEWTCGLFRKEQKGGLNPPGFFLLMNKKEKEGKKINDHGFCLFDCCLWVVNDWTAHVIFFSFKRGIIEFHLIIMFSFFLFFSRSNCKWHVLFFFLCGTPICES